MFSFARLGGATMVVLLASVWGPVTSASAVITLDTSFGGDGIVTTPIAPGGLDVAFAIATAPGGKLVAAGNAGGGTSFGSGGDFAVARYRPSGALDTTFGGDGTVTTDLAPPGDADEAHAVAVQSNGKVVAAGIVDEGASAGFDNFAVVRYNTDGTPDTTFGVNGKVTTDTEAGPGSNFDNAWAVAIQPDGKIVVAGEGSNDFALVRYESDGDLDPTFDGDGILTTDVRGGDDEAHGVVVQADGKIVAGGFSQDPANAFNREFALVRYTTGGSPDTTFDDGAGDPGEVTTAGTSAGSPPRSALVLQPDQNLVMAGGAFTLARYETDGALDMTFDDDGKVFTSSDPFNGVGNPAAHAVALQADGKIVAAGRNDACGFNCDFALARYSSTGGLDGDFDGDGVLTTTVAPAGQIDIARAVAIEDDGDIVAGGYADMGPPDGAFDIDFALVRYVDAPAAPEITDTDPDSPANNNRPEVKGTVGAGDPTQIKLFKNASCSGAAVVTSTVAQFTGVGITVKVPDNSTTNITARAFDADGDGSACSNSFAYTEDSLPPGAPTITDTDPNSPANDRRPEVKGTVAGGDPTHVAIYKSTTCTESTKAVTGTVAQFTGSGITVTVPTSTTTQLSARALDATGNKSACSNSISYTELP